MNRKRNIILHLLLGLWLCCIGETVVASSTQDSPDTFDKFPESHLIEAFFLANPFIFDLLLKRLGNDHDDTEDVKQAREEIKNIYKKIKIRYETITSKELVEIMQMVGIDTDVSQQELLSELTIKLQLESIMGAHYYHITTATSSLDESTVRMSSIVMPSPFMTITMPKRKKAAIKLNHKEKLSKDCFLDLEKSSLFYGILLTDEQITAMTDCLHQRDKDPTKKFLAKRKKILHSAGIPDDYQKALENPRNVRINKKKQKIEVRFYNRQEETGSSPNAYVPVIIKGNKKNRNREFRTLSFHDTITNKNISLELVSFIVKKGKNYDVFTRIGNKYYGYKWNGEEAKWEVKQVSKKMFYKESESPNAVYMFYKKYIQKVEKEKKEKPFEFPPIITIGSLLINVFLGILIYRLTANRSR